MYQSIIAVERKEKTASRWKTRLIVYEKGYTKVAGAILHLYNTSIDMQDGAHRIISDI